MTRLVYRPPPPEYGSRVAVRAIPIPNAAPLPAELSVERWEQWVAKGVERDRVVRRRIQIIAGITVAVGLAGWLLWAI